MPNDAKLGLVVGVGLVLAVAVVFFRKESPSPRVSLPPRTSAVGAAGMVPAEASGTAEQAPGESVNSVRPVPRTDPSGP